MGTKKYIVYLAVGREKWYGNRRVYEVNSIPWYRLGKMVWEQKSILSI